MDLHWCLADHEPFEPEERITEEALNAIRDYPSSCIFVRHDTDGNELIKITCNPNCPVIYRVGEMDLASLTHTLRFPD